MNERNHKFIENNQVIICYKWFWTFLEIKNPNHSTPYSFLNFNIMICVGIKGMRDFKEKVAVVTGARAQKRM